VLKHLEVQLYIVFLTLKKLHEFSLFRQVTISNDYTFYEDKYPVYYNFGCLIGILAFGFLSDNVLRKKMYITIVVVTLA
jgi:hypothetical protein